MVGKDQTADGRLPGGYADDVVKVGDTIRRPWGKNGDFVSDLLLHLESVGWAGAPRYLGKDEKGRQILSYVEGHVAYEAQQPPGVWTKESGDRAMTLIRELHDLTAGTALAGDAAVVMDNDLSPRNTVYRQFDGLYRPVAFIDWAWAMAGSRLLDVAHAIWQFLDLGPRRPGPEGPAGRAREMCEVYGLEDRSKVVETILWLIKNRRSSIASLAAKDDGTAEQVLGAGTLPRILEMGALEYLDSAYLWMDENRGVFEEALQ